MTTPLQMLQQAHTKIKEGRGCSDLEAFEILLQFIAYKISYEPGIPSPSLKLDLFNEVNTIVNTDTLSFDGWDWLGEFAKELGFEFGGNKLYAASREKIEESAEKIVEYFRNLETPKPHRFLDALCASGRMMIALHAESDGDLIIYAGEPDLILYRMALLNAKIHGVPAVILHADYRRHDLAPNSPNWKYANLWNPVSQEKLEPASQIEAGEVVLMSNEE
jgi:hypothetical protein